jgi:hypothetical protein
MADRPSHRKTADCPANPPEPWAPGAYAGGLGAHISVPVRSNQGDLDRQPGRSPDRVAGLLAALKEQISVRREPDGRRRHVKPAAAPAPGPRRSSLPGGIAAAAPGRGRRQPQSGDIRSGRPTADAP